MDAKHENRHQSETGDARAEARPLSHEELLLRVNELAAHYNYGRIKVLPDISNEAKEILSRARVVVVDDLADILATTGIDLLVATEDNIVLVHHTSQSESELTRAVVAANPDVLLMDGALNNGVTGASLIRGLREAMPTCCIIAHSGSQELNQNMLRVGAFDAIDKGASGGNIERVASIYQRFREQRAPTPTGTHLSADEIRSARVIGPLTGPDLEALVAFSFLLQGYLLTVSTSQERRAMGVPEGLLDEQHLAQQREKLERSDWWLTPLKDLDLEKQTPIALEQCPLLRAFIARLQNAPQVFLTREEAQSIHDEITAVVEAASAK